MDKVSLDIKSFFIGWGVILIFWWVLFYIVRIPSYLLPSPEMVLEELFNNLSKYAKATFLTGSQAIVGWAISIFVGIIVGAVVYYLKLVRKVALPVLVAIQTTPVVAIVPVITIWIGYGWFAKTIVASIVAIFPVIVATYDGVSNVKENYINLYKLAGKTETFIFFNVRIKSAWLTLLPAIKVSIIFAIIGSIVSEFMGGNEGIGHIVMKSVYNLKNKELLTVIIISALLGNILLLIIDKFGSLYCRPELE